MSEMSIGTAHLWMRYMQNLDLAGDMVARFKSNRDITSLFAPIREREYRLRKALSIAEATKDMYPDQWGKFIAWRAAVRLGAKV